MAARSSLPKLAIRLDRLRIRADFLRAARGIRRSQGALTLETCPTPDEAATPDALRVGFTASRKVGNAVARNRAKRRLRAIAAELLPLLGLAGNDYVLVARTSTLTRPFSALQEDLKAALAAAHKRAQAKPGTDA